jgi:hypothetical protein
MTGSHAPIPVTSAAELLRELKAATAHISISGSIDHLPSFTLLPGQTLSGLGEEPMLIFDAEGIALAGDNRIERLGIVSPADCRAVHLAGDVKPGASFHFADLTVHGQFQLIFGDNICEAFVAIRNIAMAGCDTRGRMDRPHANGVSVLQGAVTIWNRAESATTVHVEAENIDIGSADNPVVGTGLFLAGSGHEAGGRLLCRRLVVGGVHSMSGLREGTTETVAGGIFILQSARIDTIIGTASVVTRGANAVPIDNWGSVRSWKIDGNAISHGSSAIGFINAGTIERLELSGDIETFGDGARGCGIYGPTGSISARAIRTHGNAAIGVQIIDHLGKLTLTEGVFTDGAPGEGLVKGRMVRTPAHAIHVEHGAALIELDVPQIVARGPLARPMLADGYVGGRPTH